MSMDTLDDELWLDVKWEEVTLLREVYNSPSSVISVATLHGKECILKKTRITTEEAFERFEKEVAYLRRCAHPNIIKPLGLCHKAPHFALVLPYYPKADLHELLHLPSRAAERYDCGVPLGLKMALLLSLDMARAVENLHAQDIVHRDLKPANMVVGNDWVGRLIDLEISSELKDVNVQKQLVKGKPSRGFHHAFLAGTLFYMAPELLLKSPYSPAADVYSLGVTINELLTGVIPFSNVRSSTEQMHTVVESRYNQAGLMKDIVAINLRPTLITKEEVSGYSEVGGILANLVTRCWDADANVRPSAGDVVKELEKLCSDPSLAPFSPTADRAAVAPVAVTSSTNGKRKKAPISPGSAASSTSPLASSATASSSCSTFDGMWQWSSANDTGYSPVVSAGAVSSPGTRGADRMEDAHVIGCLGEARDIHVYGVFDGHGGATASKYAASRLLKELGMAWSHRGFKLDALGEALQVAFVAINNGFLTAFPDDNSGSTAIVCVLAGRNLLVANAGDCRAVLCRGGKPLQCSTDHTCAVASEQARLQALGKGDVIKKDSRGTLRLNGQLQVTRSFGDRKFIQYGLTAEPEITTFVISEEDTFLVICTDGVWDFLTNQQAVQFIHDTVKHPDYAAKRILSEALAEQSDDNLTCIVAFLTKTKDLELSYSSEKVK